MPMGNANVAPWSDYSRQPPPFKKMPVELTSKIFVHTQEEFTDCLAVLGQGEWPTTEFSNILNPFTLSQVSQSWHCIALDTPSLWQNIVLDVGSYTAMNPAAAKSWLRNARDAPVTLHWAVSARNQVWVADFVIQNAARWEQVHIFSNSQENHIPRSSLYTVLERTIDVCFHSLRFLHLDIEDDDIILRTIDLFMSTASKLEYIFIKFRKAQAYTIDMFQHKVGLSNIARVGLNNCEVPPQIILDILQNCPTLTSLSVEVGEASDDVGRHAWSTSSVVHYSLTDLEITCSQQADWDFFFHRASLPYLANLRPSCPLHLLCSNAVFMFLERSACHLLSLSPSLSVASSDTMIGMLLPRRISEFLRHPAISDSLEELDVWVHNGQSIYLPIIERLVDMFTISPARSIAVPYLSRLMIIGDVACSTGLTAIDAMLSSRSVLPMVIDHDEVVRLESAMIRVNVPHTAEDFDAEARQEFYRQRGFQFTIKVNRKDSFWESYIEDGNY